MSALRQNLASRSFQNFFSDVLEEKTLCLEHTPPSTSTCHSKFLSKPCPRVHKRSHFGDQNVLAFSSYTVLSSEAGLLQGCALFITQCQLLDEKPHQAATAHNNRRVGVSCSLHTYCTSTHSPFTTTLCPANDNPFYS